MSKTYDTYKDSDIAWIGEIPSEWGVCRLKDSALLYTGNSIKDENKDNYTDSENARPYIATKDIDATYLNANYENGLYIKLDDIDFRVAPKNSTLLCIEGGSAGRKKAFMKQDVSFVNKLCCFAPNTSYYGKFLYYFICSPNFEDIFASKITGMIGGVNIPTLKDIACIMPSLSEQTLIADFLDHKCDEIDSLISLQEEMITELQAYKQSLITETVTKGLDPNAPMKDSGEEWIGKIPEHWKVCRFKTIAKVRANLVRPDDYLEMPQVAPDCIEKGSGKIIKYQTVKEANVISDNHLFYKGQIVYSKIRPTLNKVIIAPFDGLCCADMYPIETSENLKFFLYQMLSTIFNNQVAVVVQDRVKMPKINKEELDQILMIIPPLNDQEEIVNMLDEKTQQIDSLIDIKQSKIDELKEYKKSIIFEYVTGKKRV